ncbi:hypothetical protein [Streptodolium elevatio]
MPAEPLVPIFSEQEIAALARAATTDLAQRLAQRAFRPLGAPGQSAEGAVEGDALATLHVLVHMQRAVEGLMDEAAAQAVGDGAGYPQLGRACRITRQGARKRWPGLVPTSGGAASGTPGGVGRDTQDGSADT